MVVILTEAGEVCTSDAQFEEERKSKHITRARGRQHRSDLAPAKAGFMDHEEACRDLNLRQARLRTNACGKYRESHEKSTEARWPGQKAYSSPRASDH